MSLFQGAAISMGMRSGAFKKIFKNEFGIEWQDDLEVDFYDDQPR